jgi:hypothetical protein
MRCYASIKSGETCSFYCKLRKSRRDDKWYLCQGFNRNHNPDCVGDISQKISQIPAMLAIRAGVTQVHDSSPLVEKARVHKKETVKDGTIRTGTQQIPQLPLVKGITSPVDISNHPMPLCRRAWSGRVDGQCLEESQIPADLPVTTRRQSQPNLLLAAAPTVILLTLIVSRPSPIVISSRRRSGRLCGRRSSKCT